MRAREREGVGGVIEDGTPTNRTPRILKPKYLDIRWAHTEVLPAHLLVGFQVAVFTGNDPNNTDAYLVEPVRVGPSERRAVVSLRVATTQNVRCAVQALYSNGNQSSWRVLGGAVATDPDTVTMAVQDLSNVTAGAVKPAHLAAAAVTSDKVAASAIATQHLLLPPSDNLVPNGYSEAGTAALGKSPEGSYLVNDPANAREGNWCRKLPLVAGAYSAIAFAGEIPCASGDQFYAEAWVKLSAAPSAPPPWNLYLRFLDRTGALVGLPLTTLSTVTATYQRFKVTGTAPAGAVSVSLILDTSGTPNSVPAADGGKSLFIDAVSMRKMVTFDLLSANTLKTSNYAEDGNGIPTAGAKLDNVGTALKVASGNLQVGRYPLEAMFYKSLVTLDGPGPGNRCFYRGNNNGAVRGGAPNIDRVRVECADNISGASLSWAKWQLFLEPQSLDDNFDGMRHARVELWVRQTANLGFRHQVLYAPLADRVYRDAVDATANNAGATSFEYMYAGNISGLAASNVYNWYLLVSVVNVYGASASKWFLPSASRNTAFASQYAAPFSGATAGGGGGGGSDGDGYCPAPWEPILLAEGGEVPADLVRPGMRVLTWHEASLKPDVYEVAGVSSARAQRYRLVLEDGRTVVASRPHPLYAEGRGWTALADLRPGDVLLGTRPGRVRRVEPEGEGDVVKLSVHGARTYQVKGLLSHNAKQRE
ncbi:Hint domain-containing protein [Pyxidicoccus caerfyrddinensis]|uniref:Hint domain-containing protein n=1 Tax=Pyxidicoccus caerfyrddinensis TaxID=2709663 RepID=UPI0013DB5EAB|nr:Hint domain-containing protein [Pyxidicoccus caerfyrddinensis]